MTQRVGVMGGTFDPPHAGHVAIAQSFLNSGLLDRLLILPTPVPPHKPDAKLTPYEHRLQMTRICFEYLERTSVDDFELALPSPHYTIYTLRKLSKQNPQAEFSLCIGQDSLNSLKSWYKWEELVSEYDIYVTRRPDATEGDDAVSSGRIYFVDHQPHRASSTAIRDFLKKGEIPEHLLCDGVPDYIREHRLYQQ